MRRMYLNMMFMLLVSFFVMYAVMFLNVSSAGDIYFSLTRIYMSLLMVCPMAVLMLLIMNKMYPSRKLNSVIYIVSALIFTASLYCLREQVFVSNVQYMKAMIPHHSSAILTSEHANINDPEVKKLSLGIIESQKREIEEMKQMIDRLK